MTTEILPLLLLGLVLLVLEQLILSWLVLLQGHLPVLSWEDRFELSQ